MACSNWAPGAMGCLQRTWGKIVCAACMARARDLHDLFVMQAQQDVPFGLHARVAISVRIWVYDRICGPINYTEK